MLRLVAFLRGINVGGRSVKKEKLKEAFTGLGFQNVSTYRQSGNIIFETTSTSMEEIRKKIEDALRGVLSYDVSVFIRTIPQLKRIIDMEPFRGQSKEGTSFLVTMLPSSQPKFPLQLPLTIPKSTAQIISAEGKEVFSLTHGGGEGALPNPFVESKLKAKATTRNMNIIREIVEKFG
ncbi:MAG: DUF1697 domain-containing protein [Candidatus Bathyarchaeia archaeon]|jgi:uncharacterized protein (DUF1697 family)